MTTSIYDFNVTREDGTTYSLSEYRNRPMVIVNTATKCGYAVQFEGLQELYAEYRDQGLVVLGFPSNQFKQEVDSSQEAAASCRMKYGVDFPMHEIHDVNGEDALPLFKYLEHTQPGPDGEDVAWNFTKFVVDKAGQVVARFEKGTEPKEMTTLITELL